jgi:cytochrome c553
MQHTIIIRMAWVVTFLLIAAAAAFAWGATFKERQYAAAAATLGPPAPAAAPAPDGTLASTGSAARSDGSGLAAFEKRCAKCHEPSDVSEWQSAEPGNSRDPALFEFLQKHRKAPDAENRAIADYFASQAGR